MRKAYIRTFGCQMNMRDSEVVCGLLKASGYRLTAKPEEAGVIIFNSCSVRQHAEDRVWSEIGRISKLQAPSSKPIIGLIGCMAQNYKEAAFERSPDIDFVAGPADIAKIPGIIKTLSGSKLQAPSSKLFERKIWETDSKTRPEEIYHSGFYADKNHAFVVISEGCSNFCSYCVVPYVRGSLRHRSYKEIIREIEVAIGKGITSITLLGQNVNAYLCASRGRKPTLNFIDLLGMVNSIKGLKDFSFITSHPKDTRVDLFRAMADLEKLKKCLHLPVQSGSERMLKAMNRGYTRKYYLDLADNYRKIVKGGSLTTDIIVGFPGESEADFQDTCELVRRIRFNAAFIFKYSPRPRTEAFNMADTVEQTEKEKRHKLILDLQKEISKGKNVKSGIRNPKL